MTISELMRTVEFVKKFVIDAQIPKRFQDLIQVLQQNAQARQPRPGQSMQPQPITQQKNQLLDAIRAIRVSNLSLNERQLLATYIDLNLLGDAGANRITLIFAEHNLDPMGAIQAFNEMNQKYSGLISAANNTINVLKPFAAAKTDSEIEEGQAVIQIAFKNKASIRNVSEWREHTDDWWQIIRSFGLLTGSTPDQAKVLSFEQGSLIVEVCAALVLVKAIGLAADQILTVITRALTLKKTIVEIKQLDLTNKQIENDLEKEASAFEENKIKEIARQVIAEINNEKAKDGEIANATEMAIKRLFEFLDHGGTVDCRLTISQETPENGGSLRTLYDGIRRLETQIDELKLLTHNKPAE